MVYSTEYASSEYITYCAVIHMKEENNFFSKDPKTHKIQDGGMFTYKFKMAAIFVKLCMTLPIHGCIDLSNPLRIDRDDFF